MATLHVRNVPEEVYERLKRRAADRHRSLSAEVIDLLSLAPDRSPTRSQGELLRLAEEIRGRRWQPPADGSYVDSVQLLREDRDR